MSYAISRVASVAGFVMKMVLKRARTDVDCGRTVNTAVARPPSRPLASEHSLQ